MRTTLARLQRRDKAGREKIKQICLPPDRKSVEKLAMLIIEE